jgi:sulfur-oxidizing protein SoxZ
MGKARIKLPASAKKGEVIEIKTLVEHPMESGLRKGADGQPVPRNILNRLTVTFNGKPVLETKLYPAVAANPYMSFFARVGESGTFEFTWTGDDGEIIAEKAEIKAS